MSAERYLIGKSTLDVSLGCLRRNGADVSLRPKSFALLHYLVTHAGRLVTKDELLSKIWPDVIVTEDSLTRCISEVRAALEDSDQTMIKTVSKRLDLSPCWTSTRSRCRRLTGCRNTRLRLDERAGCCHYSALPRFSRRPEWFGPPRSGGQPRYLGGCR